MSTINTTMDDFNHTSDQESGRKIAMRRLTIAVLAIITGMAGMTLFSRFQASQNVSTAILPVAPQMSATLIPSTDAPSDLSKKLADATMQLQQAKKEEPIRGYANELPASDEYVVNANKSKPTSNEKVATVVSTPNPTSAPIAKTEVQESVKVATAQQPETPKASTIASNSKDSSNTSNHQEDSALITEKSTATASASHPADEKSTKDAKNAPSQNRYAHKDYAVQVGMFSNPNNAQSLQSKLNKAGVRAVVETRVYLGPFKNKTEADEALRKAKEMGINAVVLAPTKL